ncbi:hypothetical protein NGB36_12130 [Streptomyces sp. RB6PN25]|uniref:Uncharacterized protein n=1 Tax=Streptomyces humicola TaxID=2953240 RepID=A0ABT1PUJ4_9ACTN|nr:hypothetical protein [Streptomyces humicola]MCQ4081327.1 hypothetical protein [Streptomyces humicola]
MAKHDARREGKPRTEVPDEGLEVPADYAMWPGASTPAESSFSELSGPEREPLRRGWGPGPVLAWVVIALLILGLAAWAIAQLTG